MRTATVAAALLAAVSCTSSTERAVPDVASDAGPVMPTPTTTLLTCDITAADDPGGYNTLAVLPVTLPGPYGTGSASTSFAAELCDMRVDGALQYPSPVGCPDGQPCPLSGSGAAGSGGTFAAEHYCSWQREFQVYGGHPVVTCSTTTFLGSGSTTHGYDSVYLVTW